MNETLHLDGIETSDDLMIATTFIENFCNDGKRLAICFTNEYWPTSVIGNLEPRVGNNFSFSHMKVSVVETI